MPPSKKNHVQDAAALGPGELCVVPAREPDKSKNEGIHALASQSRGVARRRRPSASRPKSWPAIAGRFRRADQSERSSSSRAATAAQAQRTPSQKSLRDFSPPSPMALQLRAPAAPPDL